MPAHVVLAVLLAALLHAAWNAMVKGSRDVLLDMVLVAGSASLIAALLAPFVPMPPPAAWPYLVASMLIHVGYFSAVVGAYRAGDLSHAYPLMRGVAPLLVALSGAVVFGEVPHGWMGLGIVLVCAGVLSMALVGGGRSRTGDGTGGARGAPRARAATAWALLNAVFIAAYTLIDARGVRLTPRPESYVVWMFLFEGLPFCALVAWLRGRELAAYAAAHWARGFAGGACSAASYGIALWAMTVAPVAAVASLRETSVIFGALIGARVLKERVPAQRWLGVAAVTLGVIALRAG